MRTAVTNYLSVQQSAFLHNVRKNKGINQDRLCADNSSIPKPAVIAYPPKRIGIVYGILYCKCQ